MRRQSEKTDLRAPKDRTKYSKKLRSLLEDEELNPRELLNFQKELYDLHEASRKFKPYVIWLVGPPGSGKSHTIRAAFDKDKVYEASGYPLNWFDGYDAHEVLVIDDYRKYTLPFVTLLAMLDCYGHRLPVKNGHRQLLAKVIIITTNELPEEMFKTTSTFFNEIQRNQEEIGQLKRRIDATYILVRRPQ